MNMASSPGSFSEGLQSRRCCLHDVSGYETDALYLLSSHSPDRRLSICFSRGVSSPHGDAFHGGNASPRVSAPRVGLFSSFSWSMLQVTPAISSFVRYLRGFRGLSWTREIFLLAPVTCNVLDAARYNIKMTRLVRIISTA
jgi:hypothetical protein